MKITDAMALAAAKEIKKQSGSTCEFGETCDWCDCWRAFYPEERLMKSDQKEVAAARAVIEAALDAMGPGPDEHRGR